jgi:hypothetical protein
MVVDRSPDVGRGNEDGHGMTGGEVHLAQPSLPHLRRQEAQAQGRIDTLLVMDPDSQPIPEKAVLPDLEAHSGGDPEQL